MRNKSKYFHITGAAALTTLSFLALYAAMLVPSGKFAACLGFQCITVYEFGKSTGIASAAVLSVLILIFGTNKLIAAFLTAAAAPYPVVKALLESKSKAFEYVGKLLYFMLISAAAALAAHYMLQKAFPIILSAAFLSAVVTDYALTLFISVYIQKIRKLIIK